MPRSVLAIHAVCLAVIVAAALMLNRLPFAMTDDFHYFTYYFQLSNMGYGDAVADFWKSPYAPGRYVAVVVDLLGLSLIEQIEQLRWIRLAHLGLLIGIFFFSARTIESSGAGRIASLIIALTIFTAPGIWHLYLLNYGSGVLFGLLTALIAAWATSGTRLAPWNLAVFTAGALLATHSYQPLWCIPLLGIVMRQIGETQRSPPASYPSRTTRDYLVLGAIVLGILILNYLEARLVDSPRAGTSSLSAGVHFVLNHYLPMTILPWVDYFAPGSKGVILASWVLATGMSLVVLAVFRRQITVIWHTVRVGQSRALYDLLPVIVTVTLLLPLTLGLFVFTDLADAYRRVSFAAMAVFSIVCVCLVHLAHKWKWKLPAAGVVVIFPALLILGQARFIDVTTQQMAASEWGAARCASRMVELTAPHTVNRQVVASAIPKRFEGTRQGDEFQVLTLSYPSGAMLVWLSHLVERGSVPFDPWIIQFSTDGDVGPWDAAFAMCAESAARRAASTGPA